MLLSASWMGSVQLVSFDAVFDHPYMLSRNYYLKVKKFSKFQQVNQISNLDHC